MKYTRQYYQHFTEKQWQVADPAPLNNTWKDRVLQAAVNALVVIPSTRAKPAISSTNRSTTTTITFSSSWPDSPEAHKVSDQEQL